MFDRTGQLARGDPPGWFRRIDGMTAALLATVALAAVTPGTWTGATAPAKSHAHVRFDVTPSTGSIQPFARVDLVGCRSTRTVHLRTSLGVVSAERGRLATRVRFSPPARASRVRLRLRGHFTSATRARGVVRGRLRYAGGHVCRILPLVFVAHPVALPGDDAGAVDESEDLADAIVDDADLEDGDYEEDDPGDAGDEDEDDADDGP